MEAMGNEFLTIKEVADLLKVSVCWLHRKVRCGIVPNLKVGGVIRIPRKDLDLWLAGHMNKGKLKI